VTIRVLSPTTPTPTSIVRSMLAEARSEVVWVDASAPEDFYSDPQIVDLVWKLGDIAAELRGRLAQRRVETPSAQLFDQDEL